jgi:hypothetical protein
MAHHDRDHAEHALRRIVDERAQGVTAFAERHQRKAEEDRKQQDLQDLAGRKRADHGVGNDVQEEVDAFLFARLLGVGGDLVGAGHRTAETRAGFHQVSDHKSDDEREGRDDLEIDQRLDADAPDLFGILDV